MSDQKRRTPERRLATAYHEAGHAVVHALLGLTNHKVSIRPEGADDGQCLTPSVPQCTARTWREQRSIARKQIVGCYAGLYAERLVDPYAPDWRGREDEDNARFLSRTFEVFPRNFSYVGDSEHLRFLDKLRAESRRLVHQYREAIAAVAEQLLRKKELDGEEVKQIIEPYLKGMDRFGR
jgi:ATP-dependent Zn protease